MFAAWLAIQARGMRALEIIFRFLPRCAPETIVAALADAPRCQPRVFAEQCPMAGREVVSAATTDRADTLMPLIASAFASYSAAHPRYRFGHDD